MSRRDVRVTHRKNQHHPRVEEDQSERLRQIPHVSTVSIQACLI